LIRSLWPVLLIVVVVSVLLLVLKQVLETLVAQT
jgi:preprotein translocase subunit SecE